MDRDPVADLEEQITKNQQQHLEGAYLRVLTRLDQRRFRGHADARRRRRPAAGVQHQKTIKQTHEAVVRLDLEKTQAVRKADRCDLRVL